MRQGWVCSSGDIVVVVCFFFVVLHQESAFGRRGLDCLCQTLKSNREGKKLKEREELKPQVQFSKPTKRGYCKASIISE